MLIKPIVFLTFSSPSALLDLKVPNKNMTLVDMIRLLLGKRLLPKTPLKTSSLKKPPSYFKKKISYQTPNSPSSFKTAEEDLGESLTELFLEEGASLEEQRKRSVEKIIQKAKD